MKKAGVIEGILYGIGCGIGSSIFILLGNAIKIAGPGVIISLILGGILIFLTALNYSELETSLPISGGAYNFGKEGIGGFAFLIGFFLWIANISTCVFSALAFTIFVDAIISLFFPIELTLQSLIPLSIIITLIIGALYIKTQRFAAKTLIYSTILLIIIFIFFIISGLVISPAINAKIYKPNFLFAKYNFFGVIQMFALLFICFTSITSNLAYFNPDLKNPAKNIPRVNILSIFLTLIIYLSITFVVLINIGGDPEFFENSYILLAEILYNILGPVGFIIMCIAAILSSLIGMNAAIGSAVSVFQALSRDNYIPKKFNEVKKGVPIYSLFITVAMALLFIILVPIDLAAEMAVTIYFFGLGTVNIAAIYLRGKRKKLARPFKAPLFPYLPLSVGIVCYILAFTLSFTAIVFALIVLIFGLSYYFLTITDRHSIVITLAGIKSFMIVFTGIMIWLVANFAVIESNIPNLNLIFREIFLRILIYICIFAIATVVLDIVPIREFVYYFVRMMDKEKVAIKIGGGQIIELDKNKNAIIHKINLIIGILELLSSCFIFYLFYLLSMDIISISRINLGIIEIQKAASKYLFIAASLTLGICLFISGIILLYINYEQKKLGI
ncbi:MAG: APC family permease [Promethearchaeia archaeon]